LGGKKKTILYDEEASNARRRRVCNAASSSGEREIFIEYPQGEGLSTAYVVRKLEKGGKSPSLEAKGGKKAR